MNFQVTDGIIFGTALCVIVICIYSLFHTMYILLHRWDLKYIIQMVVLLFIVIDYTLIALLCTNLFMAGIETRKLFKDEDDIELASHAIILITAAITLWFCLYNKYVIRADSISDSGVTGQMKIKLLYMSLAAAVFLHMGAYWYLWPVWQLLYRISLL